MQTTARVLANPFLFLDENGAPSCAVALADAPGRYVAAERKVVKGKPFDNHPDLTQDKISFEFSGEVFELRFDPISEHRGYQAACQEGALIPADKASAETLRVPFADPVAKLDAARKAAAAEYEQRFGKAPDWATQTKADKAGKGSDK